MRRVVGLAIGLVLSTLLLGGGWLWSSLRERDTRMREERARLVSTADAVRGAVDESLEELREREHRREFYLYNHYYSPPDVLAISDPVAVSPLARPPRDRRLVGHFQIDASGGVHTPYTAAEDAALSPLAARIQQVVLRPSLAALRTRAAVGPTGPRAEGSRSPLLALSTAGEAGRSSPRSQQLTVGLNAWANVQAQDITLAQAGDSLAGERVRSRGRQAPHISRRNVGSIRGDEPDVYPLSSALLSQELAQPAGLDNLVQREAEVEYTTMAFREVDDQLLLDRTVTHEDVTIVQGVLLDVEHLTRVWIPHLVERHAAPDLRPRVVRGVAEDCALRRPASAVLSSVWLCFEPSALAAATQDLDTELRFQVAALFVLLLVVILAAAAIVLAARRGEALSRQKSAFVAAVSHELRTPLTTLRMHAEMLDEGLVAEERRDKVHRELVRESVRLARLVDNVLSLGNLEEGVRRIRRSEGDLRAHVREVVEGQRPFAKERGFAIEGPGEGPPTIARFDPQAVDQIVVNLLDNAVKYGRGDDARIEVWVGEVEGRAALAVLDRGPGIPAAEREKVLQRFHRVETAETAHAPGTGIGLALVDELVRAHGGRVALHAREGGGLVVRVTLSS